MNGDFPPFREFLTLLVLLGAALIVAPALALVAAQSQPPGDCPPSYPVPCVAPAAASQLSTWPINASVKVNIDPSFDAAKAAAIEQSFRNFQAAGGPNGNGSGVTFSFTRSATSPSMNPPSGTYNVQVWNAANPSFPTKAGYNGITHNGTHAISQEIWINPQATDPCAVAQTSAHEIGHGHGLEDCIGCPNESSVMLPGRRRIQ